MAQIPTAESLGARPVPVSGRAITEDRSGVILSTGAVEAGKEVSRTLAAKQEREDRFAYAQAKSSLLNGEIALRRKLVEDEPDYNSWEEKYREGMGKLVDATGGMLDSGRDRQLFQSESQVDVARGAESMFGKAFERQTEEGLANLGTVMENNRDTGLRTADVKTRLAIMANTLDNINGARDSGYISADQAQVMREDWTTKFATSYVEAQDIEERLEMLRNPKETMAAFMDEGVRGKMLQAAEREGKVTKTRGAVQAASDNIMRKYGIDTANRSAALADARREKDPDVRAGLVSDINHRFNELVTIDAEELKAHKEQAGEIVNGGGQVTEIPDEVWAELPLETQRSLELRSRQVSRGVEPVQNDDKYYDWTNLSNQEKLKVDLATDYRAHLDNQHYDAAVSKQQQIRDAIESGNKDAATKLDAADTFDQLVTQSFISSNLFKKKPTASSGADERKRWANLESEVGRQLEAASAAKGGKLTPQEKRTLVEEFVINSVVHDGWLSRAKTRHVSELSESELASGNLVLPEDDRDALANIAKSAGKEVTGDKLQRAYAAALQGDREGMAAIMRE